MRTPASAFTELVPSIWITQARWVSLKYEIGTTGRTNRSSLPAAASRNRLEADDTSRLFTAMNRLHDLPSRLPGFALLIDL